jgi:hypothetical protein
MAFLSEEADAFGIEGEREEGVFVVLAEAATVSETGPVDETGRGDIRIHAEGHRGLAARHQVLSQTQNQSGRSVRRCAGT